MWQNSNMHTGGGGGKCFPYHWTSGARPQECLENSFTLPPLACLPLQKKRLQAPPCFFYACLILAASSSGLITLSTININVNLGETLYTHFSLSYIKPNVVVPTHYCWCDQNTVASRHSSTCASLHHLLRISISWTGCWGMLSLWWPCWITPTALTSWGTCPPTRSR